MEVTGEGDSHAGRDQTRASNISQGAGASDMVPDSTEWPRLYGTG